MIRTLAIKACDLSSVPGKHMVQGENQLPQAAAPSDDIIGGIRSLFSEASPTAVVPCGSKEEKQSGKESARVL